MWSCLCRGRPARPVRGRRRDSWRQDDCSPSQHSHLEGVITSLRKLHMLQIDGPFPGHPGVAISGGQEHIERADAIRDALLIPDQLIAVPSP
jgi:hypothetical protein